MSLNKFTQQNSSNAQSTTNRWMYIKAKSLAVDDISVVNFTVDNATVNNDLHVIGNANIDGDSTILGNNSVGGNIDCKDFVCENAEIKGPSIRFGATINPNSYTVPNTAGLAEANKVLQLNNLGTAIQFSEYPGTAFRYIVGPSGNYTTIQAALDASDLAGLHEPIFVQWKDAGYTEDLVLKDLVFIYGQNFVEIIGNHVLPSPNNQQLFTLLKFSSPNPGPIFLQSVDSTQNVGLFNCLIGAADLASPVFDFSINTLGAITAMERVFFTAPFGSIINSPNALGTICIWNNVQQFTASSLDSTLNNAQSFSANCNIDSKLILNSNSGSVFNLMNSQVGAIELQGSQGLKLECCEILRKSGIICGTSSDIILNGCNFSSPAAAPGEFCIKDNTQVGNIRISGCNFDSLLANLDPILKPLLLSSEQIQSGLLSVDNVQGLNDDLVLSTSIANVQITLDEAGVQVLSNADVNLQTKHLLNVGNINLMPNRSALINQTLNGGLVGIDYNQPLVTLRTNQAGDLFAIIKEFFRSYLTGIPSVTTFAAPNTFYPLDISATTQAFTNSADLSGSATAVIVTGGAVNANFRSQTGCLKFTGFATSAVGADWIELAWYMNGVIILDSVARVQLDPVVGRQVVCVCDTLISGNGATYELRVAANNIAETLTVSQYSMAVFST